jgi:ankyrin repeat protein
MTNAPPPEEKKSFWDSTTGLITKITALLTALSALFLAIKPYLSSSKITPASETASPAKDPSAATDSPAREQNKPPEKHAITADDIAAFLKAGETGDLVLLQSKLDLGIETDATLNGDPATALVNAVTNNKPAAVNLLLEHQANPNTKIKGVSYPIIEAAFWGRTEVVASLIRYKADLNIRKQDGSGFTALMFASINGHKEVVQALIDAGADVDEKAFNNSTALDFANASIQPIKVQIIGILNAVGAHSGLHP